MGVLRDVFRARGRSVLTIVGVAVGVCLIVIFGAMSEKSSMQLDAADSYRAGSVVVADEQAAVTVFSFAQAGWMPRLLSDETVQRLSGLPGVARVLPQASVQLDPEALWVGVPAAIVGGYSEEKLAEVTTLRSGRYRSAAEVGTVVLGAEVAEQMEARAGARVELRGEEFEVVGLLERSAITAIDQGAFVSLEDARRLFLRSLSKEYRATVGDRPVTMSVEVIAEDGVDAGKLASLIEREIDGVDASGPEELKADSRGTATAFDGMVMGTGLIALFAGGLSVLNTMIAAAIDRRREVGIKRAMGASAGRITRDVLVESLAMGAMGGVLGIVAGALSAAVLGQIMAASAGLGLFALTPRLIAASFVFALVLGTLGGLYPAWYAARLDPIDALAQK